LFNPIHRWLAFDGFFLSNRVNADGTGAYLPTIKMDTYLNCGVALDLVIVKATVSGGIGMTASIGFRDPLNDGKLRMSQIVKVQGTTCEV
jgi:hypothetical protein